jgi:hypothetical protein
MHLLSSFNTQDPELNIYFAGISLLTALNENSRAVSIGICIPFSLLRCADR